ncbi:MAG: type III polyketide synthase [Chitinophagales bacterium]
MPFVLYISTAVPEYCITKDKLLQFYTHALAAENMPEISKKLHFLIEKAKITDRYSCIPDFEGEQQELFTNNVYAQSVDARMRIFKEKIFSLATKAIDKLFKKNASLPEQVTHIITVNCTGLYAPGLEFDVAKHYQIEHAEKVALNFLGCYAALKALKHAHYIAQADPTACILIVSAELCSIHFMPSITDEDILANLLFADGAAAALVCGDDHPLIKNKVVLNITSIGSACIPNTADLMTWNISSTAFRMYLSRHLVKTIKENIQPVVDEFLSVDKSDIDYWAIHPGGVKIVEAVQESLSLSPQQVDASLQVLQQYGNMSSPTILFILQRILNTVRNSDAAQNKNIFACAFGPGLTVELIQLLSVDTTVHHKSKSEATTYAVQV